MTRASKETKRRQSWPTDTRGSLGVSSVLAVGKRTRTAGVGVAAMSSSAGTVVIGGVLISSLCRLRIESGDGSSMRRQIEARAEDHDIKMDM